MYNQDNFIHKIIDTPFNLSIDYDFPRLDEFLADVYDDISSRSGETSNTISRFCLNDYLKLPLTVTNRIFTLYTQKEKMPKEFFLSALLSLYSRDLDSRVEILFTLLDEDRDGKVEMEDVRFILYQFHMIDGKYDDECLNLIIKDWCRCFEDKALTYEQFSSSTNTDVILLLLFYFSYYKPFDKETLKLYSLIKKTNPSERNPSSSSDFEERLNFYLSKSTLNLLNYIRKIFKLNNEEENDELLELKEFEDDLKNKIAKFSLTPNLFGCSPFQRFPSSNVKNDHEEELEESYTKFRNYVSRSANAQLGKLSKFKEKFEMREEVDHVRRLSFSNTDKDLQIDYRELEAAMIKNSQETKYKLILHKRTIFYFIWNNETYTYKGVFLLTYSHVSKMTEISFQNQIYYKMKITSNLNYSKFQIIFYAKSDEDMKHFIFSIRKEQRKIKKYYAFERKIAKGEFGTVIQGKNFKTKEKVAIKVLKKKKENKFIEMIKWEVEVFKLFLNNPHSRIVRSIEMFESVNTIYLVFEYISTMKLSEYLGSEKPEDTIETMQVLAQVTEGIQIMHKLGVVHRDIKADNIVMTKDMKNVKIIDFGLSKVIGPNEKASEWYGSLVYSAPEIIKKTSYGQKVDIWSLGVLFYFCIYLKYPFDLKTNERSLANQIISGKINMQFKNFKDMTILIKLCLEVNPLARLNINQVMKLLRQVRNKVLL